jgi:hypothetical protein
MAKRQKQQPKQHRYERRIILFLDFLGFKEIVDETARDSEKLQLLLEAIDRLYDIGREDADLYNTRSITTFSDSVVLSYAIHEQSAVFYPSYCNCSVRIFASSKSAVRNPSVNQL